MKRIICILLLIAALCAALCLPAASASAQQSAEALCKIDVFRGTDTGFELERAPKRSEAAVMLVRLYGAEEEARTLYAAGEISHPFEDGNTWAAPYLAWLYSRGLVKGMSETRYGADAPCRARDYALFLLRALGYQDGTDFEWAGTEDFAVRCGFYEKTLFGGTFTRGDLALMTFLALQSTMADGSGTLLESLVQAQAVDKDAAKALTDTFKKEPVRLEDGVLTLDAAAWKKASADMQILVQFDSGSETVSGGTLQSLVQTDGSRVRPDTDAIAALVSDWAAQYGTYDVPFRFDSYVKGMTTIDFIKCDYRVDEAGVSKQLMQALCAMESCTLDAALTCYRWGAPFDISQTHVEVDLDNQQLTFIKNGTVLVKTDIVTGMVGYRRTPTGLYESHNRQRNCTLTGVDYEVFVKYWVSVIGDVIGLHDASWRSVFGGDQYVYNGSHGCINIPEAAMAKIFDNIDDGTPVLIYGQNKWYEPGSDDSPATKNPVRGTTANKE